MATTPWELDQRTRSSTWPVPDPEQVMDPRVYYQGDCQQQPMNTDYMEMQPEYDATLQVDEKPRLTASPEVSGIVRPSPSTGTPEAKKPRNPWGEMSYADLITKAILSAPDKRLTLSEIYAWMIENVPYFREKANETSTSGWKNSIRHNLSLHDRFQKLPNEKTGKSSWWTVSPDVKGTKSSRRPRSSSIDTPGQPAKPKKEKRKTKKPAVQKSLSVDTTAVGNSGVSPCASPTGVPRISQWSPLPNSPGATSSPVLPRTTRAVTTSSPLLSPQFSTPQANLRPRNFDGSSNSLNETDQRDEAYSTQASTDSLNYESYPPNSYNNQIHDHFGSSSSLSSINSPLARLSFGQTQTAFPFPAVTVASGCTSPVPPGHPMSSGISSGIQSDVEMNHRQDSPVVMSPPPYEEAVQQVTQSTTTAQHKYPLTLQHSFPQQPQHPLHISNHFKRPRSTSMPIAISSHFPDDLDMKVFQNNPNFNIDMGKVLKTEMDMSDGGSLDFNNIIMDGSVTPVENDTFAEQQARTSPSQQQHQQQQHFQQRIVQCPPHPYLPHPVPNHTRTGAW